MEVNSIVEVNGNIGVVSFYILSITVEINGVHEEIQPDKVYVIDAEYNLIYEGNSDNITVLEELDSQETAIDTLKNKYK